jgi:hypothetical protein
MALFFLKHYRRNFPEISGGEKIGEWAIEAADLKEALLTVRMLLDDHQPLIDFVVMSDATGKIVWEEGTNS